MRDRVLRDNLVALLGGEGAHLSATSVLADIEPALRNARCRETGHSIWELLEHMRIAQEDILRYTLDPDWVSPEFPGGYWPADSKEVGDGAWQQSVSGFLSDLDELARLVRDPDLDLCAKIPHGGDHTYLREILIAADHNAYHLGQIVCVKKWSG